MLINGRLSHTFNFTEAAELAEAEGAALRVSGMAEAVADSITRLGDMHSLNEDLDFGL